MILLVLIDFCMICEASSEFGSIILHLLNLVLQTCNGDVLGLEVLPQVLDPELHEVVLGHVVDGKDAAALADGGRSEGVPSQADVRSL
jgi:hypothetical protein